MENIKLIKIKTIFFKIRDMLDSHEKRLEMLHSNVGMSFQKKWFFFHTEKLKDLESSF